MGNENDFMIAVTRDYAALLRSEQLHTIWQQFLDSWEGAQPGAKQAVAASVAGMRDQFLAAVADVTDAEERETLAAIFYAQVRCRWIQLNTRTGYQLLAGRVDRAIHCESGMLSALLARIESLLHPADVARLTAVLGQPVTHGTTGGVMTTGGDRDRADEPAQEEAARLGGQMAELQRLYAEEQQARARAEADAARATEYRRILEERTGIGDPEALALYVADLRSRLAAMEDLEAMLRGLEQTEALAGM